MAVVKDYAKDRSEEVLKTISFTQFQRNMLDEHICERLATTMRKKAEAVVRTYGLADRKGMDEFVKTVEKEKNAETKARVFAGKSKVYRFFDTKVKGFFIAWDVWEDYQEYRRSTE